MIISLNLAEIRLFLCHSTGIVTKLWIWKTDPNKILTAFFLHMFLDIFKFKIQSSA